MNYQKRYSRLASWFNDHQIAHQMLIWSNTIIVWIMYIAYFGLLLWLIIAQQTWWPFIVIPGGSFVLLSIVRKQLNYARPYEEWAIKPLIPREGHGASMPSRHVFSAVMIALCVCLVQWWLGLILLVLALALAAIRVIGGVHYPRDVIVGALCGLLAGAILFSIISYQ